MQENNALKYQNNFLSNVIFRLDFTSLPEIISAIPDELDSLLKNYCPELNTQETIEYHTIIENGRKTDRERRFSVFQYTDNETSSSITIAHNHLVIEFKKYKNFTFFNEFSEKVVSSFISALPGIDFRRIGLRYINQIVLKRGNPFTWSGYIDQSLTNVVDKFFQKSPSTSRSVGQVILNNDDYNVNFIYGTHNSEFPARISRKEFIIDIDCYSNFVEQNNIFLLLQNFNIKAKSLFEKSIKSKLRKKMGVIENE